MKPVAIATDKRPLTLEVQPAIAALLSEWSDPVQVKFVPGDDGRVTLYLRYVDDDK